MPESSEPKPAEDSLDAAEPRVRKYDFRTARKLTQSQRIHLGGMHSRLAAGLGKPLGNLLRLEAQVSFLGMEQLQVSQYATEERKTLLTAVISLRPGRGRIYLAWPRETAFFMMERLLGGSGDDLFTDKAISDLDKMMLKRFVDLCVRTLQNVFDTAPAPQFALEEIREDEQPFVDLLPYEVLLLASLEIRLGEKSCKVSLIYPYSLIKPWLEDKAASLESEEAAVPVQAPGLPSGLARASLPIQVRLGPTAIKVADFMSLQVGDCLQLNYSPQDFWSVHVGGKVKFFGQAGLSGNQRAVRITGVVGHAGVVERNGEGGKEHGKSGGSGCP